MRERHHPQFFTWCLSPYASSIHTYLKKRELKAPKLAFRSPQLMHRNKIIDWIKSLAVKLRLSNGTLHLGVRLMDLFMDSHNILEKRLVSICLTCLLIAAKYEEEDSLIPKLKDLPRLLRNETSVVELKSYELIILEAIDWCAGQITAVPFADYYALFSVVQGDSDLKCTPCRHLEDIVHASLREYLDLSLSDVYLNKFMCSKVAAACLLAARLDNSVTPVWPHLLADITGFSQDSLQPVLQLLIEAKIKYGGGAQGGDPELLLEEDGKTESGYESTSPDNAYKKRILARYNK